MALQGPFTEIEAKMNPRNRLVPADRRSREASTDEAPRVPAYRAGEPYVPGRGCWPAGAQYLYGPSGHQLTLFAHAPAPDLIEAVGRGEARFALGVAGPVLYLSYRFGDAMAWADVPFSWHLQHPGARATPPPERSTEDRALLWISLVDARDGLIVAQRGVTLNPGFTRDLHRAIRSQARRPFDPLECTLAVAEACRDRPDALSRLEAASAWCDGNT